MRFSESAFHAGHRQSAHSTGGRRSGFTLLEIMIAVTIFGIISTAVYSTFRVGLKSYEAGREQMVVTQSARVTLDLLVRDLRGLYYQPPNAYNRNLIILAQQRRGQELQALRQLGGERSASDEEKREKPIPGVPIDLTILGEDHEEGDSLTFVSYQTNWGTAPVEPWALARVKYFVQDGNLFRAEGPIAVERIPTFQWQGPMSLLTPESLGRPQQPDEPTPPEDVEHYLADAPREVVARGVKTFDLRYGYWTGEGWYESPDWTAHERRYRNPPMQVDPLSPFAQAIISRNITRPTDDIPAYVVVTLALTYGKDGARSQVFRTRIRLPNSSETYEPFMDPNLAATGSPGLMRPMPPQVPPPLRPRGRQ